MVDVLENNGEGLNLTYEVRDGILKHYFFDNSAIFEKKLSELQMNSVNHDGQPKGRTVCDFIASMTDRYAMNLYRKIFFPSPLV